MKQTHQNFSAYITIALTLLLVCAYIVRSKGFSHGERTTFDEDLYAYMAYEMTLDARQYNAINFSSLIREQQPNRNLPDYLWKKLFKHPPFYCYLVMFSYKLHKEFGNPVADQPQARQQAVQVSNIMGVIGIAVLFFLGLLIFDWRVGFLAAVFLTIDPVHWICSQKIWMETTLTTVMLLSGVFFIMSYKYEKKKILFLILSGCFVGGAALTKYPGGLSLTALFLYALLTRPKNVTKPFFWIMPLAALLVMLDWILWNIDVYGMGFITSGGMGYDELRRASHVLLKMTPILIVLGVIIYLLWKKRGAIITLLSNLAIPAIIRKKYFWIICSFLFVLYIVGKEWLKIIPALSLFHEPETSWRMGFFRDESWLFYLKRLVAYFPVYVFAYAAPFFVRWREREHKLLPIIYPALYLLFFIFWRNFQSRYILPALPWLLLLASYVILNLHDRAKLVVHKKKRLAYMIVLWCIVGYGIAKAVQVDALLAWTNQPCYF